jgi:hypothetical protein
LFIHLMNQMYPVGSIYMTTEFETPGEMSAHFGGTWERWAQGRVPVGVDPNDPAFALGIMGGSLGGPVTTAIGPVNVPLAGGLSITAGRADIIQTGTGAGSATHGGNPSLSLRNFSQTISGTRTLDSSHVPTHNHGGTNALTRTFGTSQYSNSTGSDGHVRRNNAANGGFSGNTTSTSIGNATITATFDVVLPRAGDSISFTRFPGFSYTPPQRTYTPQELTPDITLEVSGMISATDTTVQPYITCYMYVRVALATFN